MCLFIQIINDRFLVFYKLFIKVGKLRKFIQLFFNTLQDKKQADFEVTKSFFYIQYR